MWAKHPSEVVGDSVNLDGLTAAWVRRFRDFAVNRRGMKAMEMQPAKPMARQPKYEHNMVYKLHLLLLCVAKPKLNSILRLHCADCLLMNADRPRPGLVNLQTSQTRRSMS